MTANSNTEMTDELRLRIKRVAIEYANTQIANPTDEDYLFVERILFDLALDVVQHCARKRGQEIAELWAVNNERT